jgi:hypothetical protein
VVHNVPWNPETVAEQNFMRGKISAYEDLAEIAEELRDRKEAMK